MRATCSTHIFLNDLFIPITFGTISESLRHELPTLPVTSSRISPNIFLRTPFSNILILSSFLNVRYQISHPYQKIDKIIVLYILILKFLDIKLAAAIFWSELYQAVSELHLFLICVKWQQKTRCNESI